MNLYSAIVVVCGFTASPCDYQHAEQVIRLGNTPETRLVISGRMAGTTDAVSAQIAGLVNAQGLAGLTVTGPGIPDHTTVVGEGVEPGTIEISAVPTVASPTPTPFAFGHELPNVLACHMEAADYIQRHRGDFPGKLMFEQCLPKDLADAANLGR